MSMSFPCEKVQKVKIQQKCTKATENTELEQEALKNCA